MPSPQPFRFFDLPPELRAAVLSEILVHSDDISILGAGSFDMIPTATEPPMDLFLVSSKMYQEASDVYYSRNRFILKAMMHRLPEWFVAETGFLSPVAQDVRRRVSSLSLLVSRVGGDFEQHIEPALSDMILCGSLRNLSVHIMSQSRCLTGPNSTDSDGILRTQPLQLLFRLLNDPDLDDVELWVGTSLYRLWSRASERVVKRRDIDGKRTQPHVDFLVAPSRAKPHETWVALDHRPLGQTYGGGQNILRIGGRFY